MSDLPRKVDVSFFGGTAEAYFEGGAPIWGDAEYVRADQLTALQAENARLRDALKECEAEIDQYIRQEYPGDHPVHEQYRQRDFSANPARTALQREKGGSNG